MTSSFGGFCFSAKSQIARRQVSLFAQVDVRLKFLTRIIRHGNLGFRHVAKERRMNSGQP